jgi:hypothetical protein
MIYFFQFFDVVLLSSIPIREIEHWMAMYFKNLSKYFIN